MLATRSRFFVLLVLLASLAAAARAQLPNGAPGAGRVDSMAVRSAILGADRTVWVYTPPGYDASRSDYPLLVAFDGSDYVSRDGMNVPHALDSLLAAGATPALVAVFIDDGSGAQRIAELGNSARFTRFLAEELVPWVRTRYRVTRDPRYTVITGSSAGGLAAANAALAHPELFGNVLSQSGAFWRGDEGSNGAPYEWLTAQVTRTPKRDVHFLLDVGSRETLRVLGGTGPVFIEANRRFRDALAAKGYSLAYTEVPDGVHAPVTWRPRLPVDLVAITGGWPKSAP